MSKPDVAYSERLRVPVRWWLQGGLLVASFWLALIVSIPERAAWGITAVVMLLLAMGFAAYGRARIVVSDGWLHAGRAKIELKFVGPSQPLDPTQTRAVSGHLADARAYLLLRPYLPRGVRIEIQDPLDPTPYWLVCSRRAEDLAQSVNEARRLPAR